MLEILQKQKSKIEEEIEDLYEQRRNASVDARGGYTNRINSLKEELEEFNVEIKKKGAKPPDKIQISCYIIVSTKEKVKQFIGEECFCLLDEDRYHESEIKLWKPFFSRNVISEILQDFKKKSGYNFDEQYLDGEISDEKWMELDNRKKNSIVIIDLLSLYDQNKRIARCYNNPDVTGVITPSCRNLIRHDKIYELLAEIRDEVFHLLNINLRNNGSSMFEPYIYELDDFNQKLSKFIENYYLVTNQINTSSEVRGMKIGFSQ